MIDSQIITNPPHYVQGRKIEPIQVIEKWSFCHHLACVVKYVARAGRKNTGGQNPILEQTGLEQTRLEDLKKAEWYLMREIEIKNACPCIPNPRPFPTAPEAIAKDWLLSPSLSQVIFYLTCYQRLYYRLPFAKAVCLKQALTHLRAEMKLWEDKRARALANQSQNSPHLGKPVPYGTNIIIFKGGKPCVNPQE